MLKKGFLIVLQVGCAAIFLMASMGKFTSDPSAVMIFQKLGMEPHGRYIIAVVEFTAALCLVTRRWAAIGGLLGFGTMLGAFIAHVSLLGWDHSMIMVAVLVSTFLIVVIRRKEIPFLEMG